MFKQKPNYPQPNFDNTQLQRLFYEIDELNRKVKNLNNRLRRVEGFLGLSITNDETKTNYFE